MNELIIYLTELKLKLNTKSNLQFAMKIGVSSAGIDGIMKGRIVPGDELCERIAEISGDRPEVIIALAHKSRAKTDKQKNYWDKILKAVTAATFLILFILPSFVYASTILNSSRSLYIMLNRLFQRLNKQINLRVQDSSPPLYQVAT